MTILSRYSNRFVHTLRGRLGAFACVLWALVPSATSFAEPGSALEEIAKDTVAIDQVPDSVQIALDSSNALISRVNTMLRDYIDFISMGNLESAEQFWEPSCVERANRFGVQYDNVGIKADLNSIFSRVSGQKLNVTMRGTTRIDSVNIAVNVSVWHNLKDNRFTYYFGKRHGYWWLVFPHDYWTSDWTTRESKYFRIHIAPGREPYVTNAGLSALDEFVDSTGVFFGLDTGKFALMAQKKIDYYYCMDETQVRHLTGVEVRGLHDLASDALICAAFPHTHEVTHFLANYHLEKLPLTTLPLFREGLATCIGGRAGRSGAALMELAAQLLRMDYLSVDSLFELSQFHAEFDAGLSYPAAGLFMKFLLDTYGVPTTFAMYRRLSGALDSAMAITTTKAQQEVASSARTTWPKIAKAFHDYYTAGRFRADELFPRIIPGHGAIKSALGDSVVIDGCSFYSNSGNLYVTAHANSEGELPRTVFFALDSSMVGSKNELYEEQFGKEATFEGYRYALRWDANEAGLYDYSRSSLVAKYISSMDPSTNYFDSADNTVRFRYPLRLSAGVLPSEFSKSIAR